MQPQLQMPQAIFEYLLRSVEAQIAAKRDWAAMHFIDRQALRPLSYLYTHAESPLRGSSALADQIRAVYQVICDEKEDDGLMDPRLLMHVTEARRLLDSAGALDLVPGIDQRILSSCQYWHDELLKFRYLSHFTSANCGTSTNHVAMYATCDYRIGSMFGRQDFAEAGLDAWNRLVDDQEEDGYWAETTGGPVVYYNHFTFTFVGRMGRWTGNERFMNAARKGARFHRRFHYPDGLFLETIDGRNRYRPYPIMWGDFIHSETAEGRAFAARKLASAKKCWPVIEFGHQGGERAANLCEDHEWWVHGPVGEAEVDRRNYVEQLSVPGAVRRQGAWFVSLQGILALPRGQGFTISRTSLLSLWHEKIGLIVNGSGEPSENNAQSFKFTTRWEAIKYAIPERARLFMGKAGSDEPARIVADYPGGTGVISARFISDREIELEFAAKTQADRYPVMFTLQLELRDGDRVNGRTLGEVPILWSPQDLRGKIETSRYSIALPDSGAYFQWPHDPYNPYDVVNHRSGRHDYVSLLQIPLGPQGARVRFTISD